MKALEKDDQNVYAVIGLTNTIAEHGLVSESQKQTQMPKQVRHDSDTAHRRCHPELVSGSFD